MAATDARFWDKAKAVLGQGIGVSSLTCSPPWQRATAQLLLRACGRYAGDTALWAMTTRGKWCGAMADKVCIRLADYHFQLECHNARMGPCQC